MKPPIKLELAMEIAAPELQALRGGFPMVAAERSVRFQFKGRDVVSFASWDILGIANRHDVVGTPAKTVDRYGWGPGTSRLSGGVTVETVRCEARAAQFFGGEASLLFSTKSQSVLSLITALFAEGDVIFSHPLVQSPVSDACALVGADFIPIDSLESPLLVERSKGRRRVCIFVESISIVTGDLPDFTRLFSIADTIGAWVIIDESAALGVLGLRGAGSADSLKWHKNLLARISSFNRALCFSGSVIVGPCELVELLTLRSRYLRVECAEPPALAVGIANALDAVEGAVVVREQIVARAKSLSGLLLIQGWTISGGSDSPIISILLDSFKEAVRLSEALFQRNILTEALSCKTTGRDGGAVRIILTSQHSEADVERLLESLSVIRKRRAESPS